MTFDETRSIEHNRLLAEVKEVGQYARDCFSGESGEILLKWLKSEAGEGDVVLPGQLTTRPTIFPQSGHKNEITAIDLAMREGRRQMVNLIEWLIDVNDDLDARDKRVQALHDELVRRSLDD